MVMKRCPICGEKYDDTYRDCPFCEEEEALREGEEIRRNIHGGKRASGGRRIGLITPTLIILIIIMASLLIYLLRDGDETPEEPVDEPPVEEVTPGTEEQEPVDQPPDDVDPEQTPDDGQSGVMPEDGDEPDPVIPETPDEPDDTTNAEYENAMKLPDGLSLSTTDFTLRLQGETATIRASGGSGAYKWISQDDGIASVDQNGKVTAISNGTINVIATDGNKKAVCIVRVNIPGGGTATAPSTGNDSSSTDSGSGLKAGSAIVVNGGNGVRVRSGPSTNHEILATVPNGADIQVVKSAGDGWYEIRFDNVGGVATTGYMKGEFLKNN